MLFATNQLIWFYQYPIDFRKQIDGLVILIADQLERDPLSGQLSRIFHEKSGVGENHDEGR